MNGKDRPSLNKKLRGKKNGSNNASNADPDRSKICGLNPLDLQPDDEARFEEFERLRRFYVSYTDCEQIREGLGELVDWVKRNGEDGLNEKLRAKYHNDLNTMMENEAQEARLKSQMNVNGKGKKGRRGSGPGMAMNLVNGIKKPFIRATKTGGKGSSAASTVSKHEETLRAQLKTFYDKHDKRISEDSAKFEKIVDYGLRKGVIQIHKKLIRGYGKGLNLDAFDTDLDVESIVNSPSALYRKKTRGVSFFVLLEESEKQSRPPAPSPARKGFTPFGETSSRSQFPSPSISPMSRNAAHSPQLKEYLTLYYACYDPDYIVNNRLDEPQKVAVNKGTAALDTFLMTKYKEKFENFKIRAEILQDDLHSFYREIDPSKASDHLMPILQWSLRNGRKNVNKLLRRRYGKDLDGQTFKENEGEVDDVKV